MLSRLFITIEGKNYLFGTYSLFENNREKCFEGKKKEFMFNFWIAFIMIIMAMRIFSYLPLIMTVNHILYIFFHLANDSLVTLSGNG